MALLELDDIHTYYGAIHALRGISLTVDEGEIVTLIGSNGAGKSTTLRTISGLLRARDRARSGCAASGSTRRVRTRSSSWASARRPRAGGSSAGCRVHENLEMGAFSRAATRPPSWPTSIASTACSRGCKEREGAEGRDAVGRRAADAGDRPGADGRAEAPAPRRAVDGPGADPRRADLRHHPARSTSRGRPSCWWSRTRSWPSRSRTAATSSRPARSSWPTRPPSWHRTRPYAARTSVGTERRPDDRGSARRWTILAAAPARGADVAVIVALAILVAVVKPWTFGSPAGVTASPSPRPTASPSERPVPSVSSVVDLSMFGPEPPAEWELWPAGYLVSFGFALRIDSRAPDPPSASPSPGPAASSATAGPEVPATEPIWPARDRPDPLRQPSRPVRDQHRRSGRRSIRSALTCRRSRGLDRGRRDPSGLALAGALHGLRGRRRRRADVCRSVGSRDLPARDGHRARPCRPFGRGGHPDDGRLAVRRAVERNGTLIVRRGRTRPTGAP